jgi:hypothetical protein
LLALFHAHYSTAQFLLEDGGASITEASRGQTVWRLLQLPSTLTSSKDCSLRPQQAATESVDAELSALLKIMVMLQDASPAFIAKLSPQHAELATRGRQLREQLPAYLEQQRTSVLEHCPLIAALKPIVVVYAATTPEDMWAVGLRG